MTDEDESTDPGIIVAAERAKIGVAARAVIRLS
jgi:hypothetical protein